MLNATPSRIIIDMKHIDDATKLEKALNNLKTIAGEGGDVYLMIRHSGEMKSLGFIGHDVTIRGVTQSIITEKDK